MVHPSAHRRPIVPDESFDDSGASFVRGVVLAVALTVGLVWVPLAAYLLG